MKQINRENKTALAFLMPALVSVSLLTMLPVLYTIYLSFTNCNINHMNDYSFVGLYNYVEMLTGDMKTVFFPVFAWTAVFAGVTTVVGYAVGLVLALLLNNRHMRERNIYRTLLIIPWALPATIATLSWKGLLNADYGGINLMLKSLHIINESIPWLNEAYLARAAILIVSVWFAYPFMMNVSLGALQAIPETFYEAADIDGASRWVKFWRITFPSLASSTYPLLISSFAFNFNNFGAAFLITGGGPAVIGQQYAGSTDILASTAYKMTVQLFRYDFGGALAVILFVVIASISLVQMKLSGQFKEVK